MSSPFAASHIASAAVTADVNALVAADKGLVLYGFSAHESAGVAAAAHFHIMHGATAAGGTQVVSVRLAASADQIAWFGDRGLACPNGISIDMVAGEIDIVVYYKVFD